MKIGAREKLMVAFVLGLLAGEAKCRHGRQGANHTYLV
ncbi:hypothetical protein Pyrfu_0354 [Pyrolobus fumarii 1A]|uniref:Uncharacterized protein n=1 Tax=Pyrolobus fumarii (strain DSM 11204 / 1A) TaxID=694429 RepID=G0EFQ5_PYRF1|nr:hypothetical protein Pyrfu_0354 [Pyrolobus fumarii 1A]